MSTTVETATQIVPFHYEAEVFVVILSGAGERMRRPSQGGVMSGRFSGRSKNAKTSSSSRGTQ